MPDKEEVATGCRSSRALLGWTSPIHAKIARDGPAGARRLFLHRPLFKSLVPFLSGVWIAYRLNEPSTDLVQATLQFATEADWVACRSLQPAVLLGKV